MARVEIVFYGALVAMGFMVSLLFLGFQGIGIGPCTASLAGLVLLGLLALAFLAAVASGVVLVFRAWW